MRVLNTMTAVAILVAAALAAEEKVRMFHFKKEDACKQPAGWKADKTGKGEGSVWKVVADETAPSKTGYVLAQTAEGPNALFNLCVIEDTSYKDVEISVAFKAIRGKLDQAGGLVWRYKDANNYYICRMNPLEDNFRVYLDGKKLLDVNDSTFMGAGKIGLWSKADAQTYFDDLKVEYDE